VVDVHLHRVAVDLLAPAVQVLLELLARQHAAGVEHQRVQQVELARGQRHRLRRRADGARPGPAPRPARSAFLRLAVGAAHQRAQPGRQFVQVDRLDHVVVGAGSRPRMRSGTASRAVSTSTGR
jgi:hypothetical protein